MCGATGNLSRQRDALWHLRTVTREMARHSTWVERQCGLSSAELWFLEELRGDLDGQFSDIMVRMAIQQGTASNILMSLVKNGYAVKEREANGRARKLRVVITPEGLDLLEKAPKPARFIAEALQRMGAKDLDRLLGGFRALLQQMEQLDKHFGLEPISVEDNRANLAA